MTMVKNGPDRYDLFDDYGKLTAVVEKERFGTHGHWRGWRHCVYCPVVGQILWAGVELYPGVPRDAMENWTDAPVYFANLKEVKEYYKIPH